MGQLIRLSQIKSNLEEYSNFEQQLIGMFGDSNIETFSVNQNQKTIFLNKPYVVGKNSILVFLNGQIKQRDSNTGYVELNEKTIYFINPLNYNDKVTIIHNRLNKFSNLMYTPIIPYNIHRHTYFITNDQKIYDAPFEFSKGDFKLKVYLNGLLLKASIDYLELDNKIEVITNMPVDSTLTLEVCEDKDNNYVPIRKLVKITNENLNQLIYTLDEEYKMSKNILKIYRNGILLRKGTHNDYEEIDRNSFKLNYSLKINDYLEIELIKFKNEIFNIIRDEHLVKDPSELEFKTQVPYILGESNLRIYLNGILLRNGEDEDYIELDINSFRLNRHCNIDDILEYEIIYY